MAAQANLVNDGSSFAEPRSVLVIPRHEGGACQIEKPGAMCRYVLRFCEVLVNQENECVVFGPWRVRSRGHIYQQVHGERRR